MKSSISKKVLSLFIAILMMLTMIPTAIFTFAASESYPVMKAYSYISASALPDYHAYRDSVVTATFLDEIDTTGAVELWDISASADTGKVMAWIKLNNEETAISGQNRYDLYIGGDGGVSANENSSNVFSYFRKLKTVNGLENYKTSNTTTLYCFFENCESLKNVDVSSFDTSKVTNLSWLFYGCISLEYADFSNWDTSNVTNMSYMFRNCENLKELDLSSFNTSKVTTMQYMFYRCLVLEHIYIGDGWTTASVSNLNDGSFNCCYAIVGGKDIYDANYQFSTPGSSYAKLKEEGGFLTHISEKPQPEKKKYTVTYEFIGDVIPEGVTVVSPAEYEEGTTVTVEATPTANGYEFSGWSTEDADITSGTFTISNNVTIKGSWSKLYNVHYKYIGEVPAGAPELYSYTFKAGDAVTVDGIPFVDGYVFVGWDTEDVVPTDGKFLMPEKDVTLYGYFKKPVESVKINGGDITLNKDGETVINVTVKPEDATVKDIIYESDDETVVKVDENGKITAVGEGTATITVYAKDDLTKKDTVTVTVKIPVTDITVDKTEIILDKDTTDKITATVTPEDATNKKLTYTSGDENIVKVDEKGNITAVGEGTTTITVASEDDPTITEIIEVTVKIPVTGITATDDFTLVIGEEKNVEASVNEDATNKDLLYESSNPGVVKVDSEGNVIAVGDGTTTITITSIDNPKITKTVTVTVKAPIKYYKVEYTYEGYVPEKAPTYETKTYEEGSEVTVEQNPEVDGYIFSGWSTDDADITDGEFNIYNDVVIVGKWEKINYYKVEYKYEGEVPAKAPVYEIKTYEEGSEVTVEQNPEVDGYIFSGWSTDDADITDGEFDIYNDVVIVGKWEKAPGPVTSITVPKDFTMILGEEIILDAYVNENAVNKGLTYVSDNESVIKIDADGKITTVGEGTAKITVASVENPAVFGVVTITVTAKPAYATKHYIVFGKTEKIGWYSVSLDGGQSFIPVFGNSHLEVEHGSEIIIKANDVFGDPFTFYVNGKALKPDENGYVRVLVDRYILIGALGIPVEAPDLEESLNLIQRIIKAIKDFFAMIAAWFK